MISFAFRPRLLDAVRGYDRERFLRDLGAGAGVMLFGMGLLWLGRLVRYVPVSIAIGFTTGIALLIAASQIKDWLRLDIAKMPADFFAQLRLLAANIGSFNPYAFGLGTACFIGLMIWPRLWAERWRMQGTLDIPGLPRARHGWLLLGERAWRHRGVI